MRRLQLKKLITDLLAENEFEEIQKSLSKYNLQELVSPLISSFCHPLELVRWRSITTFGWVVSKIADENPEAARIVMRRLLWSLNDESGGIGWGAPEAMAEIMCNSTLLRQEYLHMLLSYMREDGEDIWQDGNFLELPMLQRGLLWGIGNLCALFPTLMREHGVVHDVTQYLRSPDLHVVAMAFRCFSFLGEIPSDRVEDRLRKSPVVISLYENGQLHSMMLGSIAERCFRVC